MPIFKDAATLELVKDQRTEKGLSYERLMKGYAAMRRSHDSKHKDMFKRLNDDILSLRGVPSGSVHSNTFLTNMSVQYANDEYIGERIMPVVPVDKRSDVFAIYPKRERFAFPDDSVGERSQPNEISETRDRDNYSVKDKSLVNYISSESLNNQDPIFDEMVDLTEALAEGLALAREKRIAAIATNAANYGGNTATLSGTDQWSDPGSDPIKDIMNASNALWRGQGQTQKIGFCTPEVFAALARHAKILDLLKYTRAGIAKRSEIADIFGLDEILIGGARQDTANIGQTAAYSRIWGKHFGIVQVAKRPTKRSAHFGSTFRLKDDPFTSQWFDPKGGKSGGFFAKVGISEDHKIVAGDTGFLIVNAVA